MARTNIELDDRLVKEGLRLTHLKTKKDLVHQALEELVARKKRRGLLRFEGKVRWQGNLAELRAGRT